MAAGRTSALIEVLGTERDDLLADWLEGQRASGSLRRDLISDAQLRQESSEFLRLLATAVASGGTGVNAEAFNAVREMLADLSRTRARLGFTPSETAMFVFSVRGPLFRRITARGAGSEQLAEELWQAMDLVDQLGLITSEAYQNTRESTITRQQQELLELSTPVVKIWDGIVAVPLIGTLDSARTQIVMENLLASIVENGASVAIIDITGVPTVDTLVAQHLLKTVAAARLMGAECIISGIRPQIAQTIVHLGVALDTVTKSNLSDAFALALRQAGYVVRRA